MRFVGHLARQSGLPGAVVGLRGAESEDCVQVSKPSGF